MLRLLSRQAAAPAGSSAPSRPAAGGPGPSPGWWPPPPPPPPPPPGGGGGGPPAGAGGGGGGGHAGRQRRQLGVLFGHGAVLRSSGGQRAGRAGVGLASGPHPAYPAATIFHRRNAPMAVERTLSILKPDATRRNL